jgi:HSP20 family protein
MEELKPQQLSSRWRSQKEPRFIISTVFRQVTSRSSIWQPPTDVSETEEAVVVRIEIAGMRNAEFTISMEGRVLAVRGVRLGHEKRGAYHQMEIRSGDFLSVIDLPAAVDYDQIEVDYNDGFFRIVLPKLRPRNVEVK